MKCPKCHYLSFEPEPRCRNCGYDLSLSPPPDLELKTAEPYEGPLIDLTLREAEMGGRRPDKPSTLGPIDLDQVVGLEEPAPEPASAPQVEPSPEPEPEPHPAVMAGLGSTPRDEGARAGGAARAAVPPLRVVPAPERPARVESASRRGLPAGRGKRAPSTTAELPLFVKNRPEADPDSPLVTVPATPTPPLAVRRAHDVPRARPRSGPARRDEQLGPFERDLLNDFKRLEHRVAERTREAVAADPEPEPTVTGRRLVAAAVDATLLGSISAAVLWATLRLCDLGLGDAATLPIVPLAAFLLLVAAGYLLMFTVAGGQTVGKMLMRIRVVGGEQGEPESLTPRQAAVRALLTVPSVLMLGLGFLPAFAGQGLTMHDRLSHTRVVHA